MFGKKQPEQPSQSQSMSGVTSTGGVIQQGQAGRDLVQSQSGQLETQQQITNTDVVKQLENLENAIKAATLTQNEKDELLDYLRPAKREAAKDSGNKDLVGQYLKPVSETLTTMKETTEAGKSLWQTAQEVFQAITPWLGVAAHFIKM
jgi:truncated hemoglobin YjbI